MKIALLTLVILLQGCSGDFSYIRPDVPNALGTNHKAVNNPRAAVWTNAIPNIGKKFFVINNLDKESGLINVSYNGNPEDYIDCGNIVTSGTHIRKQTVPIAKHQQGYGFQTSSSINFVNRKMALEGRANIILEELSNNQTLITANVRYILHRQQTTATETFFPKQVWKHTESDSIAFNSGGNGGFPQGIEGVPFECYATGRLEQEILSSFN